MRELILDLRKVDIENGDEWADLPDRQYLENILLDNIGYKIRVKVTRCKEKIFIPSRKE